MVYIGIKHHYFYLPIVFLDESRHSLRLCAHFSGESAQIV